MELTSNQTAWMVGIVFFILTTGVTGFFVAISVKSQHSKDIYEVIEYAKKILKNVFVKILMFCIFLNSIYIILYELFSKSELTRKSVFMIVWSAAVLFLMLQLYIIKRILDIITKLKATQLKHVDVTYDIFDTLKTFIKILPCCNVAKETIEVAGAEVKQNEQNITPQA